MSGEPLATGAAACALVLLIAVAYASGRRRRPALLPPEFVAELSLHKRACLGEPAERVALELALLVGTPVDADASGDPSPPSAARCTYGPTVPILLTDGREKGARRS